MKPSDLLSYVMCVHCADYFDPDVAPWQQARACYSDLPFIVCCLNQNSTCQTLNAAHLERMWVYHPMSIRQ